MLNRIFGFFQFHSLISKYLNKSLLDAVLYHLCYLLFKWVSAHVFLLTISTPYIIILLVFYGFNTSFNMYVTIYEYNPNILDYIFEYLINKNILVVNIYDIRI